MFLKQGCRIFNIYNALRQAVASFLISSMHKHLMTDFNFMSHDLICQLKMLEETFFKAELTFNFIANLRFLT